MACKCRTIVAAGVSLCIIAALFFVAAPLLIVSKVRAGVSGMLDGAQVKIAACRLWPPGSCVLSGIDIRRGRTYSVSIRSVTARAAVSSALTGILPEVSFAGVTIAVQSPAEKIAEISRYVRLSKAGRPAIAFRSIRVADMVTAIKTRDLSLNAAGAFLLEPGRCLREISVDVPDLEFSGVAVVSASVQASGREPGTFRLKELKAGKLIVSDCTARAVLDNMDLRLEDVSGRLLGGLIRGSAAITLAAGAPYRGRLQAENLDLSVFVADFDLKEKLEISGLVEGTVTAAGAAGRYEILKGDLSALSPGGVLNIRDQAMIDTIARQSGQARDLIGKSFTDYTYDRAHASLYAEDNKLIMDAGFEGASGKRILKVVLHDFTVQGGGK